MTKYYPLKELLRVRLLEFIREPETIFWVYGFPLLLAIGLGIAFRNGAEEQLFVDVQQHETAEGIAAALGRIPGLNVEIHPSSECQVRLRSGRVSLIVIPGHPCTFLFDPTRPESAQARQRVNDILQRAAGRVDPVATVDQFVTEPGARYIDFLIPGLIGLNLLGSGMWGVGYATVDMRVRKLLKRLAATPMRRINFLWSMIGARLVFMIPELVVILGAGSLLFGVPVRGSLISVFILALIGAVAFAGLGLLIASRAQRVETVSGLMNLIQLPMWLFSGIFFAPERFPAILQPLVQALPLTQLNYALRAVILEGADLVSQLGRIGFLALWCGFTIFFALRWFRWN
jgi:ABC-2 type transport system permease protein